jgi:hypothetical protein
MSFVLFYYFFQVRLAQKWVTVPEQKKCSRSAEKINMIIPGKNRNKASLEVKECDQVATSFFLSEDYFFQMGSFELTKFLMPNFFPPF